MKITIEASTKYDSNELQSLLEFLMTMNKNQKSNGKKKGKDWLENMKPKPIDTEDVDIFEGLPTTDNKQVKATESKNKIEPLTSDEIRRFFQEYK